jgi:hypothetical protein
VNEGIFKAMCEAHGVPAPEAEFRFHPQRKWRFDWAWPDLPSGPLALECEGGVWSKGRHLRGKGFLADVEKYNQAVIMGWRLLRCTPADVESGAVFELLKRAMA